MTSDFGTCHCIQHSSSGFTQSEKAALGGHDLELESMLNGFQAE